MSCCRSCAPARSRAAASAFRVGSIAREAVDEFGLKDRKGAVVQTVAPDSAASKAGLEPGDVIIGYNGKPVATRDELVRMVVKTKPGTTVPVRVMRDRQERTSTSRSTSWTSKPRPTVARSNGREPDDPGQETSSGFGITLQNITPEIARRLRSRIDAARSSPTSSRAAPQRAPACSPATSSSASAGSRSRSAADAQRELARIPSGGTAFLRVVRGGQETFVTVTKE